MNQIVVENKWSALAQVSGSLKDLLQSSLSAKESREKLRNEEEEEVNI
jgi:hypothetical protein